jgi:hypothetical protein
MSAAQYTGFTIIQIEDVGQPSTVGPDDIFFSFFAFMSADFNSTNIWTGAKCINSALFNSIASTDIRKQLWDPTGTNIAFPIPPGGARYPYMNRKFLSAGGSGSSIGDVPIMRVAEMFFIEAEAKARAGGQDAAAAQALFTVVKARTRICVSQHGQHRSMRSASSEDCREGFRFYD